MCGIFFYKQKTPISPQKSEEIFRAIALLAHRGPEAMKCERIDDYTIVGFTFLPVMTGSETKGLQPFRYDDRWILLCNGEIYNHLQHSPPDAQSDVEAIYYAFSKYGKDCFMDYINGEFAFVLYNTATGEIIARRDPYGIRAFHKAENDEAFAYASEMKALYPLFASGDISHVIPQKNTFKPRAEIKDPVMGLINAVGRRLDPTNIHRPCAFLLSGGLDSSIICAIALSRFMVSPVRTFCVSIGDNEGTDLKYARKFVEMYKSYGIIHEEIIVPVKEALSVIPDVVKTTETFDVTTIRASTGQYLACRYIKYHYPEICALIVGEGADELFGGYVYSLESPNPEALQEDSARLTSQLYRFDCKRVDMCVSKFGMEARPAFLDLEFAGSVERDPQRFKFDEMKASGLTKILLREKFSPLLPEELVKRKKEAFSDGVMAHTHRGDSWYAAIQDHASTFGMTEKEWYKSLFDSYYKGCDHLVPEYWMPRWTANADDPSALIYMK